MRKLTKTRKTHFWENFNKKSKNYENNWTPKGEVYCRTFISSDSHVFKRLISGAENASEDEDDGDGDEIEGEMEGKSEKKKRKKRKTFIFSSWSFRTKSDQFLALSEEKMRQIESQIEVDKKKLLSQTDMAENERKKLASELKRREDDLQMARYHILAGFTRI